jgi:hypothetical protein
MKPIAVIKPGIAAPRQLLLSVDQYVNPDSRLAPRHANVRKYRAIRQRTKGGQTAGSGQFQTFLSPLASVLSKRHFEPKKKRGINERGRIGAGQGSGAGVGGCEWGLAFYVSSISG